MTRTNFTAPWSTSLKIMTALFVLILVGIPITGLVSLVRGGPLWSLIGVAVPLVVLALASLFMIRGYQLSSDKVVIRRLGWNSILPLSTLQSAEADSQAMSGSIRGFGIGGLFCFTGFYDNDKLGSYRVFATDPKRSVVLKFLDDTVVITPDDPQAFIAALKNPKHF